MPPIRTESPEKIKELIFAANAMANCVFHDDIMLCILTRLPVKSILRFKSVCKPWCELFSTPHFIKMHHGQFSSDPKNQSFIICSQTAERCTTTSLLNIESNEKKPTIIDHPYPYINNRPKNIVGCCNGLICLNDRGITMWNPAMNLLKSIQLSNVYFGVFEMVSLGFGYDAKGVDFKVVKIPNLEMSIATVEVYSVNSDSWRTIKVDFQFRVLRTTCDVIVNGNPYWLAKSDHGDVLVCFDVTKLVLKIVSLSSLSPKEGAESQLVDWKGSLAALVCTKDNERVESLDVWMFYDGEQIWRKNYSFGPIDVKVDRILQCSKNGKILGERPDGKLFVFDPESGCVKKVWLYGSRQRSFEIYGYTESLAYIKGMKEVRRR